MCFSYIRIQWKKIGYPVTLQEFRDETNLTEVIVDVFKKMKPRNYATYLANKELVLAQEYMLYTTFYKSEKHRKISSVRAIQIKPECSAQRRKLILSFPEKKDELKQLLKRLDEKKDDVFPISFKLFCKYVHYEETVNKILENRPNCKNKSKDSAEWKEVAEDVYKNYFTSKEKREKYDLQLKSCPQSLKTKLQEFIQIKEPSNQTLHCLKSSPKRKCCPSMKDFCENLKVVPILSETSQDVLSPKRFRQNYNEVPPKGLHEHLNVVEDLQKSTHQDVSPKEPLQTSNLIDVLSKPSLQVQRLERLDDNLTALVELKKPGQVSKPLTEKIDQNEGETVFSVSFETFLIHTNIKSLVEESIQKDTNKIPTAADVHKCCQKWYKEFYSKPERTHDLFRHLFVRADYVDKILSPRVCLPLKPIIQSVQISPPCDLNSFLKGCILQYNKDQARGTMTRDQPPQKTMVKDQPPQKTMAKDQQPQETMAKNQPPQETVVKDEPQHKTMAKDQPPQETMVKNQPPQETLAKDQPLQKTMVKDETPQETMTKDQPPLETMVKDQFKAGSKNKSNGVEIYCKGPLNTAVSRKNVLSPEEISRDSMDFPVTYKEFCKYTEHEQIVDEILRSRSNLGNYVLKMQDFRHSDEWYKASYEVFKSYFTSEEKRNKYNISLKPMPKTYQQKFLQFAKIKTSEKDKTWNKEMQMLSPTPKPPNSFSEHSYLKNMHVNQSEANRKPLDNIEQLEINNSNEYIDEVEKCLHEMFDSPTNEQNTECNISHTLNEPSMTIQTNVFNNKDATHETEIANIIDLNSADQRISYSNSTIIPNQKLTSYETSHTLPCDILTKLQSHSLLCPNYCLNEKLSGSVKITTETDFSQEHFVSMPNTQLQTEALSMHCISSDLSPDPLNEDGCTSLNTFARQADRNYQNKPVQEHENAASISTNDAVPIIIKTEGNDFVPLQSLKFSLNETNDDYEVAQIEAELINISDSSSDKSLYMPNSMHAKLKDLINNECPTREEVFSQTLTKNEKENACVFNNQQNLLNHYLGSDVEMPNSSPEIETQQINEVTAQTTKKDKQPFHPVNGKSKILMKVPENVPQLLHEFRALPLTKQTK